MLQNCDVSMIGGLAEIADRYDGYLVDLWGCVHNGIEPFPAAIDALLKLAAQGKRISLLSNGPRRAADLVARLDQMGVPRQAYHYVMSSGEAAWQALADRADAFHAGLGERCYHLGPPRDVSVYTGNGLVAVPAIEDADFILSTGPRDHLDTVATYEPLLEEAMAKGLPMVCANPDLVVHIGKDLVICAGLLAQRYEEMGGAVAYHGKPHSSVYERCFAFFSGIQPERLLGIGDGLRTDVLGAARHGIPSLFLTEGIHAEDVGGSEPDADLVRNLSLQTGAVPTFAVPCLRW